MIITTTTARTARVASACTFSSLSSCFSKPGPGVLHSLTRSPAHLSHCPSAHTSTPIISLALQRFTTMTEPPLTASSHSTSATSSSSSSSLSSSTSSASPSPPPTTSSDPWAVKLLWLDLEMTGLDESIDSIIEVAIRITDPHLVPLASYHAVVTPSPSSLTTMNDYVRTMHTKTGLLDRITTQGQPLSNVQHAILSLISLHCHDERVLLSGNSVHADRRFIRRYWPELDRRLHYRILDVSSWKEVFSNQYGLYYAKQNVHSAAEDIDESMAELTYYLQFIDQDKVKAEVERQQKAADKNKG